MRKRIVIGLITVGLVLLGAIGAAGVEQPSELHNSQTKDAPTAVNNISEKSILTCDGINVTSSCTIEGASYTTYIYHPATPEKTRTVTETTYREEVTGYCTLCNDGTYSPSCATGRGACSHHGGVAQWNAPRTRNVPVSTTKTIVDAVAQEAYYEKVVE